MGTKIIIPVQTLSKLPQHFWTWAIESKIVVSHRTVWKKSWASEILQRISFGGIWGPTGSSKSQFPQQKIRTLWPGQMAPWHPFTRSKPCLVRIGGGRFVLVRTCPQLTLHVSYSAEEIVLHKTGHHFTNQIDMFISSRTFFLVYFILMESLISLFWHSSKL